MTINIEDIDEKDPWGGAAEALPPEEVLGHVLPKSELPEDFLEAGRQFLFKGDVAQKFEELVIPRQVPGYKQMRFRLAQLAQRLLHEDSGTVLDIGTSHGRMIRDILSGFIALNRVEEARKIDFIGLDYEAEMLEYADASIQEVVSAFVEAVKFEPQIRWYNHDLRHGLVGANSAFDLDENSVGLITSVLTLMFVPPEFRLNLYRQIHDVLKPGASLLLVEKTLGEGADHDNLFTDVYYDDKRRNGISEEAIAKKRASIGGYLIPWSEAQHRSALHQAGFAPHNVSIFWSDLQFKGFIATKSA